ncbi:GNAT family N-acetyltransferase [Thalassococcus sp. BH17M4-6]|uniref:GNAT family N-acetyltransferase n=1 Tax=Thalassococcus sp. BH17M4-6 TaxID=3413148 RepID=UPI003BE1EC75
MTGYLSPAFGQSYAEFGTSLVLPRSGLQLLRRPLGADSFDYMGLYPYAMCADWSALAADLPDLAQPGAVSVTFVGDPFAAAEVQEATGDWALCRPFKTHYVTDLRTDWRRARPKEMRRIARRALEAHEMQIVADPVPLTDALWALYQTTVARHDVRGIQALSRDVVAQQLAVPGGLLMAAHDATGLAGAMLTFCHGATANLHLMFLDPRAHRQNTSYALIHATLEELEARGLHHANLGGAAGHDDAARDGLARFKKGWTTDTRSALICGKVLDAARYRDLCGGAVPTGGFFPAYRAPGAAFSGD